jgi:hypothetical protein
VGHRAARKGDGRVIAVIKTIHGNYNLIGTRGDEFVLQGNMNEDELRQLKDEIEAVLDES